MEQFKTCSSLILFRKKMLDNFLGTQYTILSLEKKILRLPIISVFPNAICAKILNDIF